MTKLLKLIAAVVFLLSVSVAQYAPIPNAAPQFFDASGNPLSGGKLYTYACGTTTPLASYTDQGGGTTNANPIILNSAGFPANASGTLVGVFLGPSCYKFQLQNSASSIQWTVDNIYGQFLFNGYLTLIERSAPSGIALDDLLWGDSTAHRLKMLNNNGSALTIAATSGDTFTSTTLTSPTITTPTFSGIGSGPVAYLLYSTGVAGAAIANTVTETAALTYPSANIPANTISAIGEVLHIVYNAKWSDTGTPTLDTRLRMDTVAGTVIGDTSAVTLANGVSNVGVNLTADCVFTAIGVSGSMSCATTGGYGGGTLTALNPTTVTFDTTIAHAIVATEQWGTANASNTIASANGYIQRLN